MNRHCVQAQDAGASLNKGPDQRNSGTQRTIHVLSVGSLDLGGMVHDALLEGPGFHLSIATGFLDLWAVQKHGDFQLAILHQTLTSPDLEDACRFIRHHWPQTRILVIRGGEDFLEDALYDDRIIPNVAREVLLGTIEQLTAAQHEGRNGNGRA